MTNLATLLLAKLLRADLITDDRRLNELATTQGLPVQGILWILLSLSVDMSKLLGEKENLLIKEIIRYVAQEFV